MLERRLLIRFFVSLTVSAAIFVVLLPSFESVRVGYRAVFRAFGNVALARFWVWPEGNVAFLDLYSDNLQEDISREVLTRPPLPKGFVAQNKRSLSPTNAFDTLLMMNNRKKDGYGFLQTSAMLLGYWPTAMLLSLLIAKPLPWKRKGWAMLWGIIAVQFFIAFRISVYVLAKSFGVPGKTYGLVELSDFWRVTVLGKMVEIFVDNPTASFAVPVFIWFAVAFTRADWAAIREGTLGGDDPSPIKALEPGSASR